MRLSAKKWRWLGLIATILVVAFVVVRTWVVKAVIVHQIEAKYHGKVVVGDWWFNLHSSGLTGVELGETTANDSPRWFKADRISTDVSLSSLIHGRFMPRKVEIEGPKIAFHLDEKGQPTTKIPMPPSTPAKGKAEVPIGDELPEIVTKNGTITLDQAGRTPMTITHVDARLSPVKDGSKLDVITDDPTWGQVKVTGHFDPTFKKNSFEIDSSPGFVADPVKLESIPFVPKEVWTNLEPRGPVDAKVKITLDADAAKPVQVHTELTLKGTTAKLNTLQVESADSRGHIVIDDTLVTIKDLTGKTVDGTIEAKGTLNFAGKVPRFDIDLRLRDIDVTKAPKAWQLGEVGATGRLSGRVDLKVGLEPSGPDLTGTAGRAVIEDGSFQGIPVKSLNLGLRADGGDLQYATLPEGSVDKNNLSQPINLPDPARNKTWDTILAALPLFKLVSQGRGPIGWAAVGLSDLMAYQAKHGSIGHGGLRLPKTISTQIELADVDLNTILDKAKKFGIEIPIPIAGRFSLSATATIPLGSLKNIQAYVFKGDATLRGASIDHVDLGLLTAHLDLSNGVLDLSNVRGQFVDRPNGDVNNPPKPTGDIPIAGPLPAGAFRGQLKASISPRGPATAKLEGFRLPLGELLAPVLPHPTPVSGELSLQADSKVDLGQLADPKSWVLDVRADSRRIKYQGTELDEVATEAHVKAGRLDLTDFHALLMGNPLKGKGEVDLAAPYRYGGHVSIEGWEIAKVLGFVPNVPKPSPASGLISAKGEASGTILPFEIKTQGNASVSRTKVQRVPLGDLSLRWKTDRDTIAIDGLEILAFGGKVTGEAVIPTKPGRSLEASANLKGIDAALLSSAFVDKSLRLSGKSNGRLKVTMPLDASTIQGNLNLDSPNLTLRRGTAERIEVKTIQVAALAKNRMLDYQATAETLGGKIRFHGSTPIVVDLAKIVPEGELAYVGFRLGDLWKGLGMSGGLANLDGLGAFDSNLRVSVQPFQLWGRGKFELRDIHYGNKLELGHLLGDASLTPTGWRIDGLEGELFGGHASGEAHGVSKKGEPKAIAFDFKVDRAALAKMTTAVPSLAREIEGYGSLKVAGRIAESVQASAEVLIPRARISGLPLSDLRFPAEIEVNPNSGVGSVTTRHWTARLAGGTLRGNAFLRLGADRSFQSEVQMTNVDLDVITRAHAIGKKTATGKLSGRVTLNGPHPEQIEKIRGKVDLDLDDASLIEMPVFKELDRFLGAARGGGLFEDGDIHGTIFNRTFFVEQLTLQGRLIQLHATGEVTFNGGLDLQVLINTNQVIPQSGLTLINIIPGLGNAIGRGEQTVLRLASFLESRLLKFRVSGTADNPVVQLDPGVSVGDGAVGFFSNILRVPIGGSK